MKRLTFKTWIPKLTPSGYWDNGAYILKGEVEIPQKKLDDAIITTITLNNRHGQEGIKAYKITIDENNWIISAEEKP